MRILLVEDCAATAEQVSEALTSLGHEADVACSIESTAELIARIPYDAFILDLNVGGASTLEVGEQLRVAGHLVCFASSIDPQSVTGYPSDAPFSFPSPTRWMAWPTCSPVCRHWRVENSLSTRQTRRRLRRCMGILCAYSCLKTAR